MLGLLGNYANIGKSVKIILTSLKCMKLHMNLVKINFKVSSGLTIILNCSSEELISNKLTFFLFV